jgi:hypothetical protein
MRWAFGASTKAGETIDQTLRTTWANLKTTHCLSPSALTESHVTEAIQGALALIGTGLFGTRHSVGVGGTTVEPGDPVSVPPELHQIMVSVAQLPDLPAASAVSVAAPPTPAPITAPPAAPAG